MESIEIYAQDPRPSSLIEVMGPDDAMWRTANDYSRAYFLALIRKYRKNS